MSHKKFEELYAQQNPHPENADILFEEDDEMDAELAAIIADIEAE